MPSIFDLPPINITFSKSAKFFIRYQTRCWLKIGQHWDEYLAGRTICNLMQEKRPKIAITDSTCFSDCLICWYHELARFQDWPNRTETIPWYLNECYLRTMVVKIGSNNLLFFMLMNHFINKLLIFMFILSSIGCCGKWDAMNKESKHWKEKPPWARRLAVVLIHDPHTNNAS